MTEVGVLRESCRQRGITQLCHVTQSRNLPHILVEGSILPTQTLRDNDLPFNPNDDQRLDGFDDHISCTIEYPNIWFLDHVAAREALFRDWIVFEIGPDFLWRFGTLFSPVNAARGSGRYVAEGTDAFESMFDVAPDGSRFTRSMFHLSACPTDNQAEVLLAEPVPLDAISGNVFPSQEAALAERERLDLIDLSTNDVIWKVSPEMFDARLLAGRIRSGERVAEDLAVTNSTFNGP